METININKEVLLSLDDTRKAKLREKIAKGEVSLNVIDNPLIQKEETKTPSYNDVGNVHPAPVPTNEPQKEKKLWDKTKDFVSGGIDEAKKFLHMGADGLETGVNFLNPISDITGDLNVVEDTPMHKEATKKYNENKIDDKLISNIEALARTDIRLIGEATQEQKDKYIDNVANILHRGGYDLGQDKNGTFVAVDDKGNTKAITNGFFESVVDGIVADAGEISGAAYGAYKGAELAKKIPNPIARALVILSSSGVGAVTGTAYDTAINELKGNQDLNIEDYLNELSKSAVLDVAGTSLGFGVVKVGGKLIELPKQVKDYIVNGNINGAREILKKDLKISEEFIDDALEQAKQNYKEVEDYTSKGITGKAKQQEELLAATLEKGDANIIKGAITNNETAARNLSDTIDQRTTNIQNELNNKSSKIGGEEIKNYLNGHELSVKSDFNNMRKDFSDAFQEVNYKFELEDLNLNSVFRDMSKRVQDPDAKKRFLTLQTSIKNTIYDSNAQVGIERDIDGLLDLRQQLNRFYGQNEKYLTNKKDKDTFTSLKENLDNQIYKAVNDNLPDELATRLIDRFSKSMEKYRELGALSENKVFKGIMGDAQSSEYRMDKLIKHMADDDSYVDDVLSKMSPNARQTVEVAVIRDITDSFTAKTAQGQKAIAFEDLGKELQSIKRNVRSELGKETIENLITYADKFGNKDLLYLDMAKGITTKPKHNIATTLDGKIKMETANMFFQFIQSIKPGDDAKRLALQRHIGKALEKSRTPKEFATNVYEYPELSDESKYILKSLIKENNKLMMAKNDAEAKRLLEEAEREKTRLFEMQQKINDEIENFTTPSIYEIRAVETHTPDDRFGSFSQMTTKIVKGTATPNEIEQYVKAKNKIDPEVLEKTKLKNQYPVNSTAIDKLEELKSFDSTKVNEVLNDNEYKALVRGLKNNKLPNTTKEMEEKYREKFYELNKLYDEAKELIDANKKAYDGMTFEEADKAGLVPFAKFGDNLLAGTLAGVETDEDGNIVGFDPQSFIVGMGGYTVAKAGAKYLNKQYGDKIKEKVATKIQNFINDAEEEMAKAAGGGKPPVITGAVDDQGFYSVLEKVVDEKVGGKIDTVSLTKMLEKNGVKEDEIEWSGLKELIENNEKLTKEQIQNTINDNRLVIEKVAFNSEEMMDKTLVLDYNDLDDEVIKYLDALDEKDRKLAEEMMTVFDRGELVDGTYDKQWDKLAEKYPNLDHNLIHDVGDALKEEVIDKFVNRKLPTYQEYKLDGGNNYRELLYRTPIKRDKDIKIINGGDGYWYAEKAPYDGTDVLMSAKSKIQLEYDMFEKHGYKSNHWDESNILVFTRVDDRTIDAKNTLFIEELQSDWHQDGRKYGYKTNDTRENLIDLYKEQEISYEEYTQRLKQLNNGVPNAPFKKNWAELGLKRMIQEAVANDYDKIAWTTGKQQAKRYSLEKELDTIVYNKQTGYIQGSKDGDEVVFKKVASDEEVEAMLGKELTKRLIDPKSSTRDEIYVLKGDELKFGGDGMKAFYDNIVPNIAKKLFKKYKVKPKMEELDDIEEMVWSVDITPQMKEDIKKYGQPLYMIGGSIVGLEALNETQEEN
jgi:hypothetical protein